MLERCDVLAGGRDLERAGPLIPDLNTCRRDHVRHEGVVEAEAAHGQIEKRVIAVLGFGKRREHAGRRLCGAHAGEAVVDDADRGSAPCQLVCHGTADDAGANHDDVRRTGRVHEPLTSIVPRRGRSNAAAR